MLRRLDRLLAPATWLVAALLVLMLFVGPQVVAEDEPERREAGAAPYATDDGDAAPGGAAADGRGIFVDSCGSCHRLSAADTSGSVGPSLDGAGLDAGEVEEMVRSGGGAMPAFEGRLSDAEIAAVSEFVAEASR